MVQAYGTTLLPLRDRLADPKSGPLGAHEERPTLAVECLLLAIFFLFSVIGFFNDLMTGGSTPDAVVPAMALISGLNWALWAFASIRLPMYWLLGMVVLQVLLSRFAELVRASIEAAWHLSAVPYESGIHFAAISILVAVLASYICFLRFMGITGRETVRIQNELALAHSIQRTLVPPISRTLPCFEVYGVSHPSEKVGGDLVDIVALPGGDAVAYLADIAGHGLQAGILMGMLKTAARTAPTDGGGMEVGGADGAVLSQLMQRLNVVLPQVKEAHMFATFTALWLNRDGLAFYGMAGSPPLLHWSAPRKAVLSTEEEQFPLGLLPVAHFPTGILRLEAEDIVLVATDGILEVCFREKSASEVEFGIEALSSILSANAQLPLPELAASILERVRGYGNQLDDQTLLLVRRRLDWLSRDAVTASAPASGT